MDTTLADEVNRLSRGEPPADGFATIERSPPMEINRRRFNGTPLSDGDGGLAEDPMRPQYESSALGRKQRSAGGLDALATNVDAVQASMSSSGHAISDLPPPSDYSRRGERSRQVATENGRGVRSNGGSGMGVLAGRRVPPGAEAVDDGNAEKTEEALRKKERAVRMALKDKQKRLYAEAKRLAIVDKELAELAQEDQAEINLLRQRLEVVDRELTQLDRDAQRKLAAFEKARLALNEKLTEKSGITGRLTELIINTEQRKDEKLNEIMQGIHVDQKTGDASRGGRRF